MPSEIFRRRGDAYQIGGVFTYNRAGQATALLGITLPMAKWTRDMTASVTETLHNLQPLIV